MLNKSNIKTRASSLLKKENKCWKAHTVFVSVHLVSMRFTAEFPVLSLS